MTQKDIEIQLQRDFIAAQSIITYLGTGGVAAGNLRTLSYSLDAIWYDFEMLKRKSFLATAIGDGLDELGDERGVPRLGESAAGVVLGFNGPTTDPTGPIVIVVPDGTQIRSGSGIIFQTSADITIGTLNTDLSDIAHAYALLDKVDAFALTAGAVGNVPAHTITDIITDVLVDGVPTSATAAGVACTNVYPAENGQDNELDTHYRPRITNNVSLLDRCTDMFYIARAQAHPTLGADILRVMPVRRSPRVITLWIVTKDGAGLSAGDLATLASYIMEYCPVLTTVICENIEFTPISIRFTAELEAGVDPEVVHGRIADALVDYVDWSIWEWGKDVDDAKLTEVCYVEGITNMDLPIMTHKNGAGLYVPGDVIVTPFSLPRVINLTLRTPLPAPLDEIDVDLETSFEHASS